MFIANGMVYGGEPQMPVKIQSVKVLDDMMMILTFTSGEQRLFDATILQGPAFQPLLDSTIFRGASVDHGVVTWMDGDIDCAPEYMYAHSYEYSLPEL